MAMPKQMKAIIPFLAIMVAMTISVVADETNQTVLIELRDSANVNNRGLWNNGFTQYIAVHQVYVCSVIQPPDSTNHVNRWRLQIDRTIRGKRTGEIPCKLPGKTNEVTPGARLVVLGNDHKTGFNVIGWWFHSEKTEKAIENLTHSSKIHNRL